MRHLHTPSLFSVSLVSFVVCSCSCSKYLRACRLSLRSHYSCSLSLSLSVVSFLVRSLSVCLFLSLSLSLTVILALTVSLSLTVSLTSFTHIHSHYSHFETYLSIASYLASFCLEFSYTYSHILSLFSESQLAVRFST